MILHFKHDQDMCDATEGLYIFTIVPEHMSGGSPICQLTEHHDIDDYLASVYLCKSKTKLTFLFLRVDIDVTNISDI